MDFDRIGAKGGLSKDKTHERDCVALDFGIELTEISPWFKVWAKGACLVPVATGKLSMA
jgi:hypothetical protein